jgi:bifunctional non-homologous end joining protein LigD
MPIIDRADLTNTIPPRNAEYHVWIEETEAGCTVNYQYGRIGSSLQSGTRTKDPVSPEKARKIFDKLVREKLGENYVPAGGAAPAYQAVVADEERRSGLLPQLLNMVDEARAEELICDDRFILQEKKDGERRIIRKDGDGIVGINKKGLIVPLPQRVVDEVARIPRAITLDTEQIGQQCFCFDTISYGGGDATRVQDMGFGMRLTGLLRIAARLNWGVNAMDSGTPIVFVPGFDTEEKKRAEFNRIRAARGEGVCFKDRDASYTPGRPNSGGTQLKYKFYATATCLVRAQEGSKRSVFLQVMDGDNPRDIGKVTIPANFSIPARGQLVEVRYLYAYPNGAIFQSVYLGPRNDQDRPDEYGSLKFKQGTLEEDDEG